jgi:cell division protein FtsN
MLDLQFDSPPPERKRASGGAFTALILAVVIVVGGGVFILTTQCESMTEEDADAPDVLNHAAEVEPEGQLTKELVFYNSEGELIIVPEEAAGGADSSDGGDAVEETALPDDIQELLSQIEEINTESTNGSTPDNGTEPENGTDEVPVGVTTYSVQVGAFSQRANAETLKNQLGADGFSAFIISPAAGDENPVYRVRVGPFAEPGAAKSTAAEIEERYGLATYIPQ